MMCIRYGVSYTHKYASYSATFPFAILKKCSSGAKIHVISSQGQSSEAGSQGPPVDLSPEPSSADLSLPLLPHQRKVVPPPPQHPLLQLSAATHHTISSASTLEGASSGSRPSQGTLQTSCLTHCINCPPCLNC